MEYTVSQLAKISGVSGRTLRHYDQIDLLKPAKLNESGYRIYGQKEVDLLQHILFYRELDVSLEEIKMMIHQSTFDQTIALKNHYHNLKEKSARLDNILATVEKTIANKEEGKRMHDAKKFEGLKERAIKNNEERFGKEIREKYGKDAINASNAKRRGMSEEDYNTMVKLEEEILTLLHESYVTGDPSSQKAQELAAKHKEWLMYSWTDYSKTAHAGLAEIYVADERFTSYYNRDVDGGASFLRDAILIYTGRK